MGHPKTYGGGGVPSLPVAIRVKHRKSFEGQHQLGFNPSLPCARPQWLPLSILPGISRDKAGISPWGPAPSLCRHSEPWTPVATKRRDLARQQGPALGSPSEEEEENSCVLGVNGLQGWLGPSDGCQQGESSKAVRRIPSWLQGLCCGRMQQLALKSNERPI